MENVLINEKIDVGAVFLKSSIKPKWFIWNNRKYNLKEITYTWKSKNGNAVLIHFSVTDGINLFEISFNQSTLEWKLEKVSPEQCF